MINDIFAITLELIGKEKLLSSVIPEIMFEGK